MRYLALIFSLLLSVPSLAQTSLQEISSATRRVSNSRVSVSDFETQEYQKQQELQSLIRNYETASTASKEILKNQMQGTLYTLFDLSMTQKELQAQSLKAQLSVMEGDQTYSQKSEELESLRMVLSEIENSLNFRRANRERIVQRKLKEMTE